MLAVLFGSCMSARLIRGTGLREEWHGRRSYLALPFSHSYDLPICNLRSFPSSHEYEIGETLNGPSNQLDKISHFEFKMRFQAYFPLP